MSEVAENAVTIKSGKGFEAMWIIPKGQPEEIKRWVMDFFGFTEDVVAGLTAYEVCVMAEDLLQGRSNVAQVAGGTVVKSEDKAESKGGNAWGKAKAKAKDEAPAEAEGPDHSWLIGELENSPSVEDLKRLWAQNKDAFADAAVKGAYAKRGKELKAAS